MKQFEELCSYYYNYCNYLRIDTRIYSKPTANAGYNVKSGQCADDDVP